MTPYISVIVPTYGRPERLADCLASLAAQSLPADAFDVIVVDDGSPAARQPHEGLLCAQNQHIERQRNAGPAAARNAGAALARGRLLVFMDDDCQAAPDWLAMLQRAHRRLPHALLGGRTVNGATGYACSDVAESLLRFFDEYAGRRGEPPEFVASNNMAMARTDFLALGGFDETFPLAAGEDRDFCHRWRRSGKPLVRVPGALVVHHHALDVRGFWRQQRNYGRGAHRFRRAGGMHDARVPRQPGFYLALVLHPLRRRGWSWWRRLGGVALTTVSQFAIASGILQERLHDARRRAR